MRHAADACAPLVVAAKHVLSIAVPPEPIYLAGDSARLAQVFGNLLQNACKYTEPGAGGSNSRRPGEPGQAVVRVKDTGMRPPGQQLESIFGLFVQVSRTSERSQGGLGIGLALAKRLIELHGGTITACSAGPRSGQRVYRATSARPHLLEGARADSEGGTYEVSSMSLAASTAFDT